MNNQTHITEEAMNEYLDGLLGQEEQNAFEGHLEYCTECYNRLAELRFVFQAMDELPEVMLERDFQPEILRADSLRQSSQTIFQLLRHLKLKKWTGGCPLQPG